MASKTFIDFATHIDNEVKNQVISAIHGRKTKTQFMKITDLRQARRVDAVRYSIKLIHRLSFQYFTVINK